MKLNPKLLIEALKLTETVRFYPKDTLLNEQVWKVYELILDDMSSVERYEAVKDTKFAGIFPDCKPMDLNWKDVRNAYCKKFNRPIPQD